MQVNAQSYITSITSHPDYSHINDNAGGLTPLKIVSAYNIPASTGANVKIGIVSLDGGWSTTDFNNSIADLGLSSLVNSANITTVLVDGATGTFSSDLNSSAGGGSIENTLDLYCVAGMVPKANIVLYIGKNDSINYTTNPNTSASSNSTTSFANVINRAVNEKCDVITVSWGIGEIFSNVYPNYYCGDFLASPLANASAKGITVLVASGDFGSVGSIAGNIVSAQYPATSSNVITVGGTNLTPNYILGNIRLVETVEYRDPNFDSRFGGGGGISSFIPLPDYQKGLTYQQYFKANSTPGPVTPLTTRGIPDIAAAMNSYALWFNGSVTSVGGTSAAAPIMAGMFARFMSNNSGRRPIPNAIHKILYNNLNSYYDITTGNNATVTYLNGYAASSNWDPVTGVGVPWGNLVYPMVTSGGTTVKTAANTWGYIANIRVKTDTNTWSNVRAVWTKTINGWQQSY
jgi:kumamolisin